MKKSFIRQSRSQMTRAEALLKKTPNEAPLICLETRQLLDADAVFEAWVLERWLDDGGTWDPAPGDGNLTNDDVLKRFQTKVTDANVH